MKPPLCRLFWRERITAVIQESVEARGHQADNVEWLREPTGYERAVVLATMHGAAPREGAHIYPQARKAGLLVSPQHRYPLGFEEWYEVHHQELTCKAAETGQDRECGFDVEAFEEDEYFAYLDRLHGSVVRPHRSILRCWLDLLISRTRTWERRAWQLLFTRGPWYVASACPILDLHRAVYKAVHRQGTVPPMLFSASRRSSALKAAVVFATQANNAVQTKTPFNFLGEVNTYHVLLHGVETWHASGNTCMCEINDALESINESA